MPQPLPAGVNISCQH